MSAVVVLLALVAAFVLASACLVGWMCAISVRNQQIESARAYPSQAASQASLADAQFGQRGHRRVTFDEDEQDAVPVQSAARDVRGASVQRRRTADDNPMAVGAAALHSAAATAVAMHNGNQSPPAADPLVAYFMQRLQEQHAGATAAPVAVRPAAERRPPPPRLSKTSRLNLSRKGDAVKLDDYLKEVLK